VALPRARELGRGQRELEGAEVPARVRERPDPALRPRPGRLGHHAARVARGRSARSQTCLELGWARTSARPLARLLSQVAARAPSITLLAHLACTAARPPPLRQPRDVFPVVRGPEDRTGACRGAPRAPSPRRSSRPLEPRSRGYLSARPADDDAASRGARAPRDLPRSPR
jgi:hypothetical protein